MIHGVHDNTADSPGHVLLNSTSKSLPHTLGWQGDKSLVLLRGVEMRDHRGVYPVDIVSDTEEQVSTIRRHVGHPVHLGTFESKTIAATLRSGPDTVFLPETHHKTPGGDPSP